MDNKQHHAIVARLVLLAIGILIIAYAITTSPAQDSVLLQVVSTNMSMILLVICIVFYANKKLIKLMLKRTFMQFKQLKKQQQTTI